MSKYPKVNIGVGALIIKNNKEVLLIKRRRGKKSWAIPSGYTEKKEKIYQTIIRETKEETNLDIEVKGIIGLRQRFTDDEGHNIWVLTLAKYKKGEITIELGELTDAKFFDIAHLKNLDLADSTKILLEKFKNKKLSLLTVEPKMSNDGYSLFL